MKGFRSFHSPSQALPGAPKLYCSVLCAMFFRQVLKIRLMILLSDCPINPCDNRPDLLVVCCILRNVIPTLDPQFVA
jgi:hypothetical protein